MHEMKKVEQACYHRRQMAKVESDPEAFKYEFSAFASAARSVLQYARREAKTKPDGMEWYDAQMAGNDLLGLFRDKRNLDIHHEPVSIPKDVEVRQTERIGVSDSVELELRGPDGRVKQRARSASPTLRSATEPTPARIVYRYRFREWLGTEEVPILCDMLVAELKELVADGLQRGFLTP